MSKELAPAEQEAINPQGIIGEILALENLVTEFKAKIKDITAEADKKREIVEQAMRDSGMKSLRHESGYTATMTKGKTKITFTDQVLLLEKLKENKLLNFIEKVPKQVIAEHEEIRQSTFADWLKGVAPSALTEMFGEAVLVQTAPDHLTISKPK